ncbi:MAG: hypothetical protein ISR64_03800 [Deltaproteobacteria bacterium]|nr:hypothetical protein [Deltaproteobacteria bacterium]
MPLVFGVLCVFGLASCGSDGEDTGTDNPGGTDLSTPDVIDGGTDLFKPVDPGPKPLDITDPGKGEDTTATDTFDPGGTDVVEDTMEVDGGDWSQKYGLACPQFEKIGEFRILIDDGKSGSWIQGHVSDAPEAKKDYKEGDKEGGCVIVRPTEFFCDPECPTDKFCNKDLVCVTEPDRVDVGTIGFTGLSGPVEIQPDAQFGYSKWDFEGDVYDAGARIELVAPGKDLEGFALQGAGVSRLEVPYTELDMAADQPMVFTWTPTDGPGMVFIEIDMTQHAITPVNLNCEVPDTGTLTVSADLMSQVVGSWMVGIPVANMYRRTMDKVDLSLGCVEFEVFHLVRIPLNLL